MINLPDLPDTHVLISKSRKQVEKTGFIFGYCGVFPDYNQFKQTKMVNHDEIHRTLLKCSISAVPDRSRCF
jgi:hypothetical protein